METNFASRYFRYTISSDKFKQIYLERMIGCKDGLGKPIIDFCTRIDDFVYSLSNENTPSIYPLRSEIYNFFSKNFYSDTTKTLVSDKLEAAYLICLLFRINNKQLAIENSESVRLANLFHTTSNSRYLRVPESLFIELRKDFLDIQSSLDVINRQTHSDFFKNNFYNPILEEVRPYYNTFNLYPPTPISEKVKDAAFDGSLKLGCFILFCLLFWLIASVMCN